MDDPNQALYNAIDKNEVKTVKKLLNENKVDPRANSNQALWDAVYNHNTEIVKLLLEWRGLKEEWMDIRIQDPRDYILKNAHRLPVEIVDLLFKWRGPNGEWIDPRDKDNTMLMRAIEFNLPHHVKLLLDWKGPNGEYINVIYGFKPDLAIQFAAEEIKSEKNCCIVSVVVY